ncbi:isoprenylcysteine carboxyl methyltransferase family protein [Marininema halotolerans]|uniref:Methyltransferase n=1 Tax=Marininema halotolerans TaxID=1155944 RepID=A0A1I6RK99_9BACL|nr:isoprenylcysteine carboxylmethyltransferase family protein [Marininema halotolerans]SFS65203.1 methyltransferase [Marininema halotolerans]
MEASWAWFWVGVLLLLRIIELIIARFNTRWAIAQGGYEVGKGHYPLVVGVHLLFFFSLLWETRGGSPPLMKGGIVALLVFLLAQGCRLWSLSSLGRYWNTRIVVIPGHQPVLRGPYRYLRHPNYLVVMVELLCFPLIFNAWWTAVGISLLNGWILLFVRIPVEESALTEASHYKEMMGRRHRFFPWLIKESNQ